MLDRWDLKISILILAVVLLAIAAVATGCVTSIEPRSIPAGAVPDPTATPAPIAFAGDGNQSRNDELDHDSRLEWWYYSGHLESGSGREFGFHFVVFKAVDGTGEPNLVAQLGLLDVETGEHFELYRAEAGFRGEIGSDEAMTISIADWNYAVTSTAGSHSFAATNGQQAGVELSLLLEAAAPVMLHNEIGWLPTQAGATYYYSWPRQSAVGELVIDGERFDVTGTAWFDHQWGDFFVLGKPAGWQWFAIQLDDGASLMITEARGIDGEVADTYGTYMSPSGEVRNLKKTADGIRLAWDGEWTSPDTGATYPSGWALEIDSLGLDLILIPVANDQEMQVGLPIGSAYWEGKAWVGGRQNAQSISGNAYVELSGYADPEPIEWLGR
jgi:predicted secreted hydrolase